MKLAILGSGTAIPHPRRGASGYACIAEDGSALLLECGPGATRRWPDFGLGFEAVRGVVCSHHHLDHCSDLAAIFFGRNVVEARNPWTVAGPVGHRRLVEGLEALYGSSVADAPGVRTVLELGDGDAFRCEGFHVEARVVRHSRHALGLRVRQGGRTLAFSGDSGPCDALVELCRGADLALLECSYPSGGDSRKHLTSTAAARVAREAGAERLALCHFYPDCDEVDIEAEVREAGFRGELTLCEDGMLLDV